MPSITLLGRRAARSAGGSCRPPPSTPSWPALEAQGRPLEGLDPQDRIFDIAHQTYYAYLRKHARRAGLAGLKPHDLRNTAAKLRRNNGASIEDVSAFLGHRNIATTATYLARMEGEDDNWWQGVAQAMGVA